jgi:hypothetical protein
MDPDEALRQLRLGIDLWHRAVDDSGWVTGGNVVVTAAEALDGWLSSGGFLPRAWAGNRTAQQLAELITAGQAVIDNWDNTVPGNDLAGAVNRLQAKISEVQ